MMALFSNLDGENGAAYENSAISSASNNNPALMENVKLYKNGKERDWYDNLADLYALINSIQHLEKAYIRDCITPKEYTGACSRLLVQFKSAFKLIKSDHLPTIAAFMQHFKFECPAAMERIEDGCPITIKDDKGNTSKSIADIVANFITIMDKLRLQMKAVDEILPDMRELMDQMNNLSILPADYVGRPTVTKWLQIMSTMSASSELDDGQIRQLVFDLESAYTAFQKVLHE